MNGQTTATPLDADWLDWVAENRLRGCTQESMVTAMAARGIAPYDAAAAIAAVQGSPCFRAAERLAQRLRKLESVLAHQHTTWALAPGVGGVARRLSVTRDEFLRDFVAASRPLVLTGLAADWPALRRWTPEQLAGRYGEVVVEVQSGREHDADFELNKLRHRSEMPLATLVQRVLAGAGNDLYLTANNQALKRPALAPLLRDIGSLPDWVDRSALPGAALLWLGGAGTRTPLHHDTLMLLHTQVVGRKLWHLASHLLQPSCMELAKLNHRYQK